ncbi:MAG: riboflavin synthase [Proteobacteria bacterium]|nr:riboflavin synthase [Pseudomonadota bacterium]
MFTGIVQAVGRVTRSDVVGNGARIVVDAGALGLDDVALGDSIAVEGCCLTVVARDGNALAFDVSRETLALTAGFAVGAPVNLEKSLRLADRLGGHLVQGHVDGRGRVAAFAPVAGDDGRNWRLDVDVSRALGRYIAQKGSIAINGVSLTVNGVADADSATRFHVNLIPHTLAATTLAALAPGREVNVEVDLMARYAARLADVAG